VVAWLRAQFPSLEMTIESIVADTDVVAVRIRSARTNLGKLGGFAPPTNKRFVAEQSHWDRVAGGKLCEHWATRDDLTAMPKSLSREMS
jgi:predicted ester cyclase